MLLRPPTAHCPPPPSFARHPRWNLRLDCPLTAGAFCAQQSNSSMATVPSAAVLSAAERQVATSGWLPAMHACETLIFRYLDPPRAELLSSHSPPQDQRPVAPEVLASAPGILATSAMTIGGHRGYVTSPDPLSYWCPATLRHENPFASTIGCIAFRGSVDADWLRRTQSNAVPKATPTWYRVGRATRSLGL